MPADQNQPGGLLSLPDDEQLSNMNWNELYNLRVKNRGNQAAQVRIAPFEHQAYARETVKDNPLSAPIWALMPAGYQAYKALGGGGQDDMSTPASWGQAVAGVNGVGQGLAQYGRGLLGF